MKRVLEWRHPIMAGITILILFLYLIFVIPAFGELGLGGFVSEKMIWTGTDSRLWVGSATESEKPAIAMGVPATILTPTDTYMSDTTYATLRGQVTSMAGFPTATVWFEWTYNPASYPNTTPQQTITAVGTYSATITGYDPSKTVYYRMATNADGTYYTSNTFFLVTNAASVSYRLLWNLIPIMLAVFTLITCITTKRLEMSWIAILIYVITSAIVNGFLTAMW